MVDVLLNTLRLQWVLKNELHKDVGTNTASRARDVCHHHFFDSLHEIIQVRAEESAINDGLEAVEYITLH